MQNQNVYTFRASDGNAVKLEYRDSLPSSAALAREYAASGYPDRYVVFTERQTAVSALGHTISDADGERGLYISCILRPSIFSSQAGLIGPLSALALTSALEEHTASELGIAWVSDIFCSGRKIGGCWVEGKLDSYSSYEYLIVNMSVKLDKRNFPPRLTDMMRKVFEADNISVGMIMAKSALNKFFGIYRELKSPQKHMDAYKDKFILEGKRVKYNDGQGKRTVKVIGVDKETCALIAEAKDGGLLHITSPSSVIIPSRIK